MNKAWLWAISFILLGLASCQSYFTARSCARHQIACRNKATSLMRYPVYQASAPSGWIREDPTAGESIADTMRPNCTFYIEDDGDKVRITVHTFPIMDLSFRIPPQSQVTRWKKQFDELDPASVFVVPQSCGGFIGLYFEGQGLIKGTPTKVMGWSMQLAKIYEQKLCQLEKTWINEAKLADYTIKVSGPPYLVDRHRKDILRFAQTFELIDELPAPL